MAAQWGPKTIFSQIGLIGIFFVYYKYGRAIDSMGDAV